MEMQNIHEPLLAIGHLFHFFNILKYYQNVSQKLKSISK